MWPCYVLQGWEGESPCPTDVRSAVQSDKTPAAIGKARMVTAMHAISLRVGYKAAYQHLWCQYLYSYPQENKYEWPSTINNNHPTLVVHWCFEKKTTLHRLQ